MTADELKATLLSTADALDAGQKSFPHDLEAGVVNILQQVDDQTLAIIATILQMPFDKVKGDIPNTINTLQTLNTFFSSGNATKISTICRSLAGRSFVLKILVNFI